MEGLEMTCVYSYLILRTVYHQADGPSLCYAGEIIIQQDIQVVLKGTVPRYKG